MSSVPNYFTTSLKTGLENTSGPVLSQEQTINPHCWIELSRTNFNQNICSIKKLIGPEISINAVLKSNAYGHGLVPVATLCQENKLVNYIAVFLASDALMLRQEKITKPILVLGGYDTPINDLILQNITLVIYDWQTAQEFSAKAQELKHITQVHLKIDSGLMRLGFMPTEILAIAQFLIKNQFIKITGIYSHFAESDSQDLTFTNKQLEHFNYALKILKEQGISIPYIHLANTAATLRLAQARGTMIRCGGLLYGTYKNELFYQQAREQVPDFKLTSFLSLKARVMAIKTVPANTPVGYACSFITSRPTTIAIVSLGYFDGYDRRLSNNSFVLIHDKLVPLLGRTGMNMITIDVTDIPQIKINDTVTLIGNYPGIRVQEIAKRIGAIDYEIFARLNQSLTRAII